MAKSNEFVDISHVQRLRDASFDVKVDTLPDEEVVVQAADELDGQGRKITKTEIVKRKLSERDKGLRWFDFSIDSLAMSGAIGNLQFSQLEGDRMDMADKIDGIDVSNMVETNVEDKNIEE